MCFDFEVELSLNRIMNGMDVGTFTIIRYLFPGVIMMMMTMTMMKTMMTIKMLVVRMKKIEAGTVVEMVELVAKVVEWAVELVAAKVVEWAVELVAAKVVEWAVELVVARVVGLVVAAGVGTGGGESGGMVVVQVSEWVVRWCKAAECGFQVRVGRG